MAPIPGKPLTKITLNLFTEDVNWLQNRYEDYTVAIRNIVWRHVSRVRDEETKITETWK